MRALHCSICRLALGLALLSGFASSLRAAPLPKVDHVDLQPLAAQVNRLIEAMAYIGEPFSSEAQKQLKEALAMTDAPAALTRIQEILDVHCLMGVSVNPESRVKAMQGQARPELLQNGWRTFLIKVHNEAGVTGRLRVESPSAAPVYRQEGGAEPKVTLTEADIRDRWMDISQFNDQPMTRNLSGLALEYRILQIYSRDAGKREAVTSFHVQQGTQDLGFRSEVPILFECTPARELTLRVRDDDGKPTMASFIFRDARGRVYPSVQKRLAPDFFFHAQIYRADGETVSLAPGTYQVEYIRGPEYLPATREITISPDDSNPVAEFKLERWIHAKERGWFSGDHHVHAAGCSHYTDPKQGVTPKDMMRHIVGEDLNVGCVLSWGPCWYFQKTFFDGKVHPLSQPNHLMRYDVEVSGFPSDHTGHLCLIGLTEDDFPGTTRIEQWPSWDLPVLKWGKSQGAVVGFSHSGWGLATKDKALPNFEIPPYDGIGANEYIVDVTHDAVDFISSVDTPWPFELNIWYHTNNAGFRTRLSGETDFPCIYGDRVGLGRIYAHVEGPLTFDKWLASMKAGRSYVCEGRVHLMNFGVNEREVGKDNSELRIAEPGTVTAHVLAAAWLPEKPRPEIRERPIDQKPYWDVERARIGDSRKVAVEIVVNGQAVASREILADGRPHELTFDLPISKSSWVAARVMASAHTNPVYVLVGDKPVRASKKSVQWCLEGVDQCWKKKSNERLRDSEREACKTAYDHAREVYRKLLAECESD